MKTKNDTQLAVLLPKQMLQKIDAADDRDMSSRSAFVRRAVARALVEEPANA